MAKSDDFGIGECERTARDAVVSGAPKRMAVHLPKQDGLTGFGRLLASLCKAREPRNLHPFISPG